MARGDLFLITAPSGAGKNSLMEALVDLLGDDGRLAFVVSHTTRPPRATERHGVDYHFVADAEFERMVAGERFLEWAHVYDHRYGTAADEVLPRLERGIDVVHDLDVQGAERLRARMPEAHSIFVLPPSFGELRRRLDLRGAEEPGARARRLALSLSEIERYEEFDYVIVNRDLRPAAEALAAIIVEKRHRRARMREVAEAIAGDFRAALGDAAGTGRSRTE